MKFKIILYYSIYQRPVQRMRQIIQVVKDMITTIEPSFNADCLKENGTRLGRKKPDAKQARSVKGALPSLKQKTIILR